MIGIKYISPADNSGYGTAAKAYLKGIIRSGIPVTWIPLVKGRALGLGYEPFEGVRPEDITDDEMLQSVCRLQVNYDTVIIHAVPEYIAYFMSREPEKRWIAYTVWETDIIPPHWPQLLEPCRGILVPSHFSKQAFLRRGVSCPVHVIPHVAMEQKPTAAAWFQDIDPKCFVFYTIAEWIPRKACELTIHAFLRAFQSSDNCRLIIKTGLYDRSLPGWQQRLFPVRRQILRIRSCYKQPAKVELIDKNISREQINALHRRGNCFVSLTRGEGWGLGAFEAAAAGNAIVITGYGGQIEYLPENYPYLVNYNLVHVKQNRRWSSYGANQVWAEPDVVHAAHLLRRLLTNAREAKQIGEALKTNMANRYGEKVVIEKLLDLLKQL